MKQIKLLKIILKAFAIVSYLVPFALNDVLAVFKHQNVNLVKCKYLKNTELAYVLK